MALHCVDQWEFSKGRPPPFITTIDPRLPFTCQSLLTLSPVFKLHFLSKSTRYRYCLNDLPFELRDSQIAQQQIFKADNNDNTDNMKYFTSC